MPRKSTAEVAPVIAALAPTGHVGDALQRAFDHFNAKLFDSRLPPCIILLHRKKNARGYFWPERFGKRGDGELKLHEIALNPSTMGDRTERDVLSTLVHEMCHHEQQVFGKPGKGGYHNAEWGAMMDKVGLTPKSLDQPGKRTGNKVTHEIVEGGAFDLACAELLAAGLTLPYVERQFTAAQATRAKAKTKSKTKYTCPSCDANAWAKPGANLVCGDCEEELEEQE